MTRIFRRKDAIVFAIQYIDDNWSEIMSFLDSNSSGRGFGRLIVHTHGGALIAAPGDWIIKSADGESWTCRPDIFEMMYEVASPEHVDRTIDWRVENNVAVPYDELRARFLELAAERDNLVGEVVKLTCNHLPT